MRGVVGLELVEERYHAHCKLNFKKILVYTLQWVGTPSWDVPFLALVASGKDSGPRNPA